MSLATSDLLGESRQLALKIYVDWLDSKDFLTRFTRPETVPSLFYQMNLPGENHQIVENILKFLSSFRIFEEAGGTFVLASDLDIIKRKTAQISLEGYQKRPLVKFIEYGLKLVEERFEGGAGIWDLKQMGYLFERGYSDLLMKYFCSYISDIINQDRLYAHNNHPKIAIYAKYPEYFIPAIAETIPEYSSYSIITPNHRMKDIAKTYCEITNKCPEGLSIVNRDDVDNDQFDLIFVPNGVEFYYPFLSQLKYFNSRLTIGGQFYLGMPNRPSIQRGIEPLLYTHPYFQEYPTHQETERFIKANGFTFPISTGPLDYFYFTTKEGI